MFVIAAQMAKTLLFDYELFHSSIHLLNLSQTFASKWIFLQN